MDQPIVVVGFSGSLRKGSFNTALLKAAAQSAPEGMTVNILTIGDLPLLNQDLETDLPPVVQAFKKAVEAADAVLIATPEYNYSVPGVLKNAIDWLSRPYGKNSLGGKPAAIIGTSPGVLGSSRAQYHLRQILLGVNVHVLNRPEIIVPDAGSKFDAAGNLMDAKTKEKLAEMMEALGKWTLRLKN